jgi:hypothetical protein
MVLLWYIGYGYMTNDYSDYLKNSELGYLVLPKGYGFSENPVAKKVPFKQCIKWPSYLDRQTYNARD